MKRWQDDDEPQAFMVIVTLLSSWRRHYEWEIWDIRVGRPVHREFRRYRSVREAYAAGSAALALPYSFTGRQPVTRCSVLRSGSSSRMKAWLCPLQ
jgi:hypothetical protein